MCSIEDGLLHVTVFIEFEKEGKVLLLLLLLLLLLRRGMKFTLICVNPQKRFFCKATILI